MDIGGIGAVAATRGNKRRVNKKNRGWQKRLHRRKTAVQPPTMQSEDKHGPKMIAEGWEQSTVWPSSKRTPQETQQSQRRTNDGGNILRFACSQCRDGLEYVPKDLVRHFEEKHRGSLPAFSCHMCTFSTHEFSHLQVHLLSHKDTFASCNVCNDSVQRTWPELSAHLTMCHCQNGKFSCELCQKFSTGDVRVFLQHLYAHNLGLEGGKDDLSLHAKDTNKFGPETTTQALRCQHCSYEASQKFLITKHMKAVHVCQNGHQRKKKTEEEQDVHSIAMKASDPIPKIKPRLTRSAVREMCWLTQDCLSLPGREFLDKYCHLSDPQTTLEETQQFLMKSVAGETADQKWTKALKTVLSNVPQDMNLHPKSENGLMSNSSDLTVLTVKNKITVGQNGATYAKKLKMMTASEKETVSPESAADDARCIVDHNGCESILNDLIPDPLTETKLNNDVLTPAQTEPSERAHMQENRENQELKADQEIEKHGKNHEGPMQEDRITISNEAKMTNESEEQTPVHKVVPKRKRQRRRRKARSKKANKRSAGLALKIVLKKNPVKEKQWVSQSSLSPSGGGLTGNYGGLPSPHATLQEATQFVQNTLQTDAPQKKWTKASNAALHDPSEVITPFLQSKLGEELTPNHAAKPAGFRNIDRHTPVKLMGLLSMDHEMQDTTEKSLQLLETEMNGGTGQSRLKAAARPEEEVGRETTQHQTSGSGPDHPVSESSSAADAVTPQGSYTKSSPLSQPAITPQGKTNSEDSSLARSSVQSAEVMRDREVPAAPSSYVLSSTELPAGKPIHQEHSPTTGHQWQPRPKNLERTLKLVAISPSQLVKRPAGDQPVVVLNHPDAEIPEVARIMEVVNRYRGEVQKVVLSRRTTNALAAMNDTAPKTNDPADAQSDSEGQSSVQERFVLKLKLRRLSRKKYEVVGAASPSTDAATKFRCWFCGRAFESQVSWLVHRQRHLMEWKSPNCENS